MGDVTGGGVVGGGRRSHRRKQDERIRGGCQDRGVLRSNTAKDGGRERIAPASAWLFAAAGVPRPGVLEVGERAGILFCSALFGPARPSEWVVDMRRGWRKGGK